MANIRDILIEKINNSYWWHVPPRDPEAYKKRGRFLASTFLQAEFYGRPNDEPEKVNVKNPIFGFSELEILEKLFGKRKRKGYLNQILNTKNFYEARIDLDAKIYEKAKEFSFDAVVLMTQQGEKALLKGRKPSSIELNLII
ncbi:MAG: hypothetical protein U9N18_02735 [Campylobacterota bacterium]|nr:hypothetical protein [Campylobacterota bacterium]